MKNCLRICIFTLIIILSGFAGNGLYATEYGLHFNANQTLGHLRTTLSLEDGAAYSMQKEFTLDFEMRVRSNEPAFGSVCHLRMGDGEMLRLLLVAKEGNSYAPTLIYADTLYNINADLKTDAWFPVSLSLDIKKDKVRARFAEVDTTFSLPLQGGHSVQAIMGRLAGFTADVVPMDVKDVRIACDGKEIRHWRLHRHNGDVCLDEHRQVIARASNASWLIDNHIEWKQIYSAKVADRLDVAFNGREGQFYLVYKDKVETINERGLVAETPVRGGYPAMEYTNCLVYDTLTHRLLSYSLEEGLVSAFSFDNGRWNLTRRHTEEPRHYNHARAFNPADSSFYFFGGYGFYRYRNDLFRMNVYTGRIERLATPPGILPTYSAAMTVVGDELYIFGGRGNKAGKQEITARLYHQLLAIDLKTGKARTVWSKREAESPTVLMASTMYYEPADSSFYAVSMHQGGTLWRIAKNDTLMTPVSKPILNETPYQDLDYSLYYSACHKKLYLVVDKISSDHAHDLAIYSINTPLLEDSEIVQVVASETDTPLPWYIYLIICIPFVAALVYYLKKRPWLPQVYTTVAPVEEAPEETTKEAEEADASIEEQQPMPARRVIPIDKTYYDRSRAAISFLGSFRAYDKEGTDITAMFTPRLKHLLILLVLYAQRSEQGVPNAKAMELLWGDKEGVSARNNKNVTVRKLRILLRQLGDIDLLNENGFIRIVWDNDVFCDYREVMACIPKYRKSGGKDDELLARLLELMFYGPLLSNTHLDWLDEFKEAYSNLAIDLLRQQMTLQKDYPEMVQHCVNALFRHDPLNEEALAVCVSTYYKQGKKGLAKSVYERFCNEYTEALGEEYGISFSALCE